MANKLGVFLCICRPFLRICRARLQIYRCHTYTLSTHCNTLQHTAPHCNTLQHTATHYNTIVPGSVGDTLPHIRSLHTATHCNTLQHAASHCSTQQQAATNCNSPTSHTSYARFALIRLFPSSVGFVLLCAGESGDICKDELVSYVRIAFAKGI